MMNADEHTLQLFDERNMAAKIHSGFLQTEVNNLKRSKEENAKQIGQLKVKCYPPPVNML